jgi:hypothetical protein
VLNIYVAIRAGSAHDQGDFAMSRRAGLVAEPGVRPQIAAVKEKRSFPTRSTVTSLRAPPKRCRVDKTRFQPAQFAYGLDA